MRLAVRVLSVRWRAPLRAAHDDDDLRTGREGRDLILVELTAGDGTVGYGEAAPLASYDGVAVPRVLDALHRYVRVLGVHPGIGHAEALEACWAADPLPQALAAMDMALWDMHGRRAGEPVWRLLGGAEAGPVPVNAVIGAVGAEAARAAATDAVRQGYATVKVKVGVGDDLARVRAVRMAVGEGVAVRLDANGAWDTPVAALGALADLNAPGMGPIELCEEPVHGAAAIAAVAADAPMPIAVDESTRERAVFDQRVAAAMCLKISSSGGITHLLRDARRARELGYQVFLASTLDGPLGIAAALHAAIALAPQPACGLSTLDRFEPEPPFHPVNGRLAPPEGAGLGSGLTDWYGSA